MQSDFINQTLKFQNDKIPPLMGETISNRKRANEATKPTDDAKKGKAEEVKQSPQKQLSRNKADEIAADNKE